MICLLVWSSLGKGALNFGFQHYLRGTVYQNPAPNDLAKARHPLEANAAMAHFEFVASLMDGNFWPTAGGCHPGTSSPVAWPRRIEILGKIFT